MFVHCFLELVAKGFPKEAKDFFIKHSKEHQHLHAEELRTLSLIFNADQIQTNDVSSCLAFGFCFVL